MSYFWVGVGKDPEDAEISIKFNDNFCGIKEGHVVNEVCKYKRAKCRLHNLTE